MFSCGLKTQCQEHAVEKFLVETALALEFNTVSALISSQHSLFKNGFMHIPYVSLVNDTTIRLRDNSFMKSVRVAGLDAGTSDPKSLDALKRSFASVIAQMGSEFCVYVHKVSRKVDHRAGLDPLNQHDFAAEIESLWHKDLDKKNLRDVAITISVIMRQPMLSGFASLFKRGAALIDDNGTERALERIDEVVRFLRSSIGVENTEVLTASSGKLLGFLGSIQTGSETPVFPSKSVGVLADDILAERVTFNAEGFILNDGPHPERYGQIRSLRGYPPESWVTIFDEFTLPCDYVICQSFSPIGTSKASDLISSKRRIMKSTDDVRVSAGEFLASLQERVLVQDVSLGEHHFTIALIHEDRAVLRDLMSDLEGSANNVGARLHKDSLAKRAHYFAQFPGNLVARSRLNVITNVNFADYASLHRTALGKGPEQLPWKTPITVFPTNSGSLYRMSFHREGDGAGEPPAGHTVVMGETGSGKTLLASFLIAQAMRTKTRVFLFDYRRGLEMATRALGGQYSVVESGKATGLNPLWVETDDEGVDWLTSWLAAIISPSASLDEMQTRAIFENAQLNAKADPDLRRWDKFAGLFGSTDDEGQVQRLVEEWTQFGRFGWVFGQTHEDTFSLDGKLVGFDLTQILEAQSDRERMAVLSYIFRRVERQIRDGQRTIVIVDEAHRAIDNPYFARVLEGWLATLRKQNALVIMLSQNAGQLARSRVGDRIFSFFPTQIVFPDAKSSATDYAPLRLNQAELEVVTSRVADRHFLLRDDQNSVVLNGDLGGLGKLLRVLGGGKAGEALVGADYRDVPEFWRRLVE